MSDLDQAKAARDILTKQLGDVVRQLSLGGIAVIWIIKSEPTKTGITFNYYLMWPLLFFVLSVAFDLLQYVWSAAVWDTIVMVWSRQKDPERDMPKWFEYLNIPTRIFLLAKAVFVTIGYCSLIGVLFFALFNAKGLVAMCGA